MYEYVMNEYLREFLRLTATPVKTQLITDAFNKLQEFNLVCHNDKHAEIGILESTLVDIATKDDVETDVLVDMIVSRVTEFLISYVRSYGIVVNPDILLSKILDIVSGLYILHNIDATLIELVHLQLEDEEHDDSIFKLCDILAQYTEASNIELYENIIDINDTFFVKLYAFLDAKNNDSDMSDITIEVVTKFVTADIDFNNAITVNNLIKNGYHPTTFEMLATDMYTNIERHDDNIMLAAYEIVATLYLGTNTKEDMLTAYAEKINMEAISYASEQAAVNVIDAQVRALINKLNNVR